ncbi:dTDP-4-amino-4,6-dideoxygalactose transaminase [Alphaproteobacteria bacterium]|nr:dTDP-4-amino-4,6-dideoxygalactose transaminase [Alphaproteobacteria bacterium]
MTKVDFHKRYSAPNEIEYVNQYLERNDNDADIEFGLKCSELLADQLNTSHLHLTASGTSALNIACMLCEIKPGDEVILPSFTFSSTANAVVLRGGIPVFVDVKPNTLNIDENLVQQAITKKTKAIIAVHYAGIACNMESLIQTSLVHNLFLIEDAAQGVGATYFDKPLGTIGHFGAFSFHNTKNVHCGEGGAFYAFDLQNYNEAAKIIEKGTNRQDFFDKKVNKYQWVRNGSSYVLSGIQKALLAAQLEALEHITNSRVKIWYDYHQQLETLEKDGLIQRPKIEHGASINGHIYYITLSDRFERDIVQAILAKKGINTVTHYEPLHLSKAGKRYGRVSGAMTVTETMSGRLLRLPIWPMMMPYHVRLVVEELVHCLKS